MKLEYRYNALNAVDAKVVNFVIGRLMGKSRWQTLRRLSNNSKHRSQPVPA